MSDLEITALTRAAADAPDDLRASARLEAAQERAGLALGSPARSAAYAALAGVCNRLRREREPRAVLAFPEDLHLGELVALHLVVGDRVDRFPWPVVHHYVDAEVTELDGNRVLIVRRLASAPFPFPLGSWIELHAPRRTPNRPYRPFVHWIASAIVVDPFTCPTCHGAGLVAATPGIGADGTMPCPRCWPESSCDHCAHLLADHEHPFGTRACTRCSCADFRFEAGAVHIPRLPQVPQIRWGIFEPGDRVRHHVHGLGTVVRTAASADAVMGRVRVNVSLDTGREHWFADDELGLVSTGRWPLREGADAR